MRSQAFPTAAPQEKNVNPEGIQATIREIREENGQDLHSFLLLRGGALVWEEYFRPGEADRPHMLYSVSKSFTSAAMGMAQAQGLLDLDDSIYGFFPQHAALGGDKPTVTLRHLLMMGSGFENNEGKTFREQDLLAATLAQPVIHEPGTVFNYYTLGTYLLSAAFSSVCPEGIHGYLKRKLFTPMGFGKSLWNVDDEGVPMGGFGLYLAARDMARFGQLCLNGGAWEGQQLVPAQYLTLATAHQIDNSNHPSGNLDWTQGYGYQFWRNSFGGYRADGMYGQYIVVLPDKDAVLVMTSNLKDMQKPLTAVAKHLLPALG